MFHLWVRTTSRSRWNYAGSSEDRDLLDEYAMRDEFPYRYFTISAKKKPRGRKLKLL